MSAIKDKYILALQFAERKGEFSLPELVNELRLDATEEKQLAVQIHDKQLFLQNATDYINNYRLREIKLHFSIEDKFRLLNFVALEESRASSNEAKRYAIAALVVSILTGIGSICMAKKQIDSDVNLPRKVLDDFSKVKSDISESKILLQDIKHLNDKGASQAIKVEKK